MYSIEQIGTIIKGRWLQQGATATIEYLLPDSRKLLFPATSLFFALKGPRRDGHSFLPEAYDKGVRNFVVSEEAGVVLPADANIIIVKDVLLALQALAAYHRKQFTFPVIGITGSNGKTIVKEWLNQLLEEKYAIVRSPKSYNSQTGVPLSIWQMNNQYTLGLFEAGISQAGEMDKLEKIIQPTIGIFTNIGEAHSEGFLNLRQKVKEKLQLFKHVQTLIYRSDYPEVNEGIAELVQRLRNQPGDKLNLFSWSTKTNATFRITSLMKDDASTYITASYKDNELSFKIPFTDDASLENAITCYCTLLQLGADSRYIQAHIKKLAPVAMRLELKRGINNCSVINDSYSADLSSLKIALDFLARQQQHTRKTIILSDIPESGKSEKELYQTVAATLHEKGINRFIGIGPQLIKHRNIFEAAAGLETGFYTGTDVFKKDFYHVKFQNESILLKGARVFEFEQLLPLLEQKVHRTVLEINLSSMLHNLQQYQQVLKPSTKIMAMVKASSYGSGSYEIASLLQFHKADYLAVAYADEGIELRKGGITMPIMVMNPEPNTFDALVQFDLEPDIWSFELLQSFDEYLKKEGLLQFPVHIELETGMNRLGFNVDDMTALAEKLAAGCCKVQSVFTHLVASEDPAAEDFTLQQAEKYFGAIAILKKQLSYPFIQHMANSAAILRYPQLQLDMVRLGIGLYGIDSAATQRLDLREISTLKTTVAQVKHLKKGETVGYGRKGIAGSDTVIATVRLGYADGYPRRLSNGRGKMLVNGKLAPVIGTISMDMTMLDITDTGQVQEGDEVIVFGQQLSVQQVAQWAQTIPYEIMTGISQRVKRVYFEE
ncbi:MAG TPA: bifunctional UDP-N-acetylmuramoyl-tripeptide:D-alanyl-D-alanine ligase/alanine racemase [Chitinophagaceae bacterium]|nr:bifunctional UDP-N-acetylmuramoyl-tripeptide:D-alanyl-D-alanine ligase/alanine racemase [Chitinophagaceae bacterium]